MVIINLSTALTKVKFKLLKTEFRIRLTEDNKDLFIVYGYDREPTEFVFVGKIHYEIGYWEHCDYDLYRKDSTYKYLIDLVKKEFKRTKSIIELKNRLELIIPNQH